jgi:uncharacterized radical SAM protein YgiQ
MGELTAVSLARRLRDGEEWRDLPGICHIAREAPLGSVELPAYEEVADDREAFARMYLLFCRGSASPGALSMFQRHGDRFLVHNPPCRNLSVAELDTVYEYPYENDVHPYYASGGGVRAMDTIRFSITSHRGCFGGCSFCSIALHQGRSVVSRSEESIIRQAEKFSVHPLFRGVIRDVGGPTGNMSGMDCDAMTADNPCASRSCLGEAVCSSLHVNHKRQIDLLSRLRKLPGVKHVFVASGVRYDLVLADSGCGEAYLEELVRYHVSGLLRVAPEHTAPHVLKLMGKPSYESLKSFQRLFSEVVKKTGTGTGLSFYLMAAHPGCTQDDMVYLAHSISPGNGPFPGKVQIFTPTPSTLSTLMYFSGSDPFTGMEVFVERDMGKKTKQRNVIRTFHRKTGQRPIRG